ncbi:MAG TPA: DUF1837 domain-containing protein [Candidatus Saccharimonadales bacterium]|nr:DUF1837 domain-containing protein [Candidatus Saccharimonadales bacterium]
MTKPFGASSIINQHISEADFHAYFVGFDFNVFRYDALVELLLNAVVDFSFGYHEGIVTSAHNRRMLVDAAKSIYKIKLQTDKGEKEVFKEAKKVYVENNSEIKDDDEFLKRGEFGELILHVLLRDFVKTVPLLSKIYFKDTYGMTVHGFDGVHIGPSLIKKNENSLYLGESKLYNDGKQGVSELLKDVQHHFNLDFLNQEFNLISRKNKFIDEDEYKNQNTKEEYQEFLTQKEEWFSKLKKVQTNEIKMQDFLQSVTIPLLCTYSSKVFSNNKDEKTDLFKKEYEEEVKKIKEEFDKKLSFIKKQSKRNDPISTNLNIILMLFPVPSKKELIKKLHTKLYHQQLA